jgi:predicted permease
METLLFAINAIMPIILLILLGYFLKRKSFLDEQWFKKGNKMIFRVCLPAMLFINVYNIESFAKINWTAVWYSEAVIVFLFLLGIVLVKWLVPDDKQKGVVVQCVFRSNFGIIGLPLAAALGSTESLGIAAVLSAFSIPSAEQDRALRISFSPTNTREEVLIAAEKINEILAALRAAGLMET